MNEVDGRKFMARIGRPLLTRREIRAAGIEAVATALGLDPQDETKEAQGAKASP